MKEGVVGGKAVEVRVGATWLQQLGQQRMEVLQVRVILAVCIEEDSIKRAKILGTWEKATLWNVMQLTSSEHLTTLWSQKLLT